VVSTTTLIPSWPRPVLGAAGNGRRSATRLAGPVQVGPANVDQRQVRRERVGSAELGPDTDQPLPSVGICGPGKGGLDLARLGHRNAPGVLTQPYLARLRVDASTA
jgi:hypothetical protein